MESYTSGDFLLIGVTIVIMLLSMPFNMNRHGWHNFAFGILLFVGINLAFYAQIWYRDYSEHERERMFVEKANAYYNNNFVKPK